jgi:ParB-like chromosome segregation protein Spo0J
MMDVKSIRISEIHIPRFKWRRDVKAGRVQDMAASIDEFELIQPIVVRKRKQGGYELLAGEHRLEAAKKLKKKTIAASIRDADNRDGELLGLEENLRRWQPNTREWTLALARWKELHEAKHGKAKRGRPRKQKESEEKPATRRNFTEEAAKRFGVHERTVEKAVARTEKLAPKARKAWVEEKITDSQADELAKLPPKKQGEVLPAVVEKTARETRALVKAKKAGGSQDKRIKKIISLLQESVPLATRLNEKLMSIATIIERAGIANIGGIGTLRIGYELTLTHEYIEKLIQEIGGDDE